MRELLYEIANEAKEGKIIIDGDDFNIAFNTIIYDENKIVFNNIENIEYPNLIIKNRNLFLKLLNEYLALSLNSKRKVPNFSKNLERNKLKLIISYILANATTEDFLNPINLLNRNINFLRDNTFSYLNGEIYTEKLNNFLNSNIKIKNKIQSIFMETPNKIEISFANELNGEILEYNLPSISYGITEENNEKVCYIYSIQNYDIKKESSENQCKFQKKIAREMYKINSGVLESESEEYKNYDDQKDSYPENISDVSMSSIISVVIFISLLSKNDISKIKIVPYLPIRFLSRDLSISDKHDYIKRCQLQERNNLIQENITDKFIRTFRRVKYHFNDLNITSYPYEVSEYMELTLSNFDQHFNNNILEDIFDKVSDVNNKENSNKI